MELDDDSEEGSWDVNVSNHKEVNYNDIADHHSHRDSEVHDYHVPAVMEE